MIYSTIIYEFRLLIFYLLLGLFTGACQREAIPLQLWHLVVAAPLVDSLFKHVDELHEESATAWSNPAATGKLFGGGRKSWSLPFKRCSLLSCWVREAQCLVLSHFHTRWIAKWIHMALFLLRCYTFLGPAAKASATLWRDALVELRTGIFFRRLDEMGEMAVLFWSKGMLEPGVPKMAATSLSNHGLTTIALRKGCAFYRHRWFRESSFPWWNVLIWLRSGCVLSNGWKLPQVF